jgi:hypothetical protein
VINAKEALAPLGDVFNRAYEDAGKVHLSERFFERQFAQLRHARFNATADALSDESSKVKYFEGAPTILNSAVES